MAGKQKGTIPRVEDLTRMIDEMWQRHPPRAVRPPTEVPVILNPPDFLPVTTHDGRYYTLAQFLSKPRGGPRAYDTIAALEEGRIGLDKVVLDAFDEQERWHFAIWLHTDVAPDEDLSGRRVSVTPIPRRGYSSLIQRCTYVVLLSTGWYSLPPDAEVHHRDGDTMNDLITNLVPMPKRVHNGLHRLKDAGREDLAFAVENHAIEVMERMRRTHLFDSVRHAAAA